MAGQKSNNIWDTKTYGNLKRVFQAQCAVPWQLYIELAIPAAVDAFITFSRPDKKEIYHKALGQPFIHDARQVIVDALHLPGPRDSKLTRFFFEGTAAFDLIVWYAFLMGIAADAVYNWSSDVLEMSACGSPFKENAGRGVYYGGAFPDATGWGALPYAFPDGSKFAPVSSTQAVLPPGGHCMLAQNMAATDFFGLDLSFSSRIKNYLSGGIFDFSRTEKQVSTFDPFPPVKVWSQVDARQTEPVNTLIRLENSGDQIVPFHACFPYHDATCYIATWR